MTEIETEMEIETETEIEMEMETEGDTHRDRRRDRQRRRQRDRQKQRPETERNRQKETIRAGLVCFFWAVQQRGRVSFWILGTVLARTAAAGKWILGLEVRSGGRSSPCQR